MNTFTTKNNNYEIKELLGEGTFAKVYKVNQKDSNKQYACKIIDLEKYVTIDDCLDELDVLKTLNHKNIISIIDE